MLREKNINEITKEKACWKTYSAVYRKIVCNVFQEIVFFAKSYVKDIDLAEDIVQMVFEKALLYSNSILKVPEDEILYFLTAMVKNTAFSALEIEKQYAHESLCYDDGDEGDYVEDPTNDYIQMIDLHSLREKLFKMSERHRDALLFRYVYGFKCKEIAGMFRISERSVKTRCSEARARLKKLLAEDDDYIN